MLAIMIARAIFTGMSRVVGRAAASSRSQFAGEDFFVSSTGLFRPRSAFTQQLPVFYHGKRLRFYRQSLLPVCQPAQYGGSRAQARARCFGCFILTFQALFLRVDGPLLYFR